MLPPLGAARPRRGASQHLLARPRRKRGQHGRSAQRRQCRQVRSLVSQKLFGIQLSFKLINFICQWHLQPRHARIKQAAEPAAEEAGDGVHPVQRGRAQDHDGREPRPEVRRDQPHRGREMARHVRQRQAGVRRESQEAERGEGARGAGGEEDGE